MTTDISVVRGGWDPTLQQEIVDEYEYDGGNSSSRLFERSRIKALAGKLINVLHRLLTVSASLSLSGIEITFSGRLHRKKVRSPGFATILRREHQS